MGRAGRMTLQSMRTWREDCRAGCSMREGKLRAEDNSKTGRVLCLLARGAVPQQSNRKVRAGLGTVTRDSK